VVDIVAELKDFNCKVDVYDPWVTAEDAHHEYGITPVAAPAQAAYDGIILAVAHNQFKDLGVTAIRALGKTQHILYDLKYIFPTEATDLRL
jgi:UDP-N-acetyl-D-galactosamine dehydrogenase